MTTSIVFIDTRVADYQTLIDGLEPGTEYYLIDEFSDGLDQIVARLQGRTDIDALHIISHGSSGTLYLGSTVLDESSLSDYQTQLAAIGSSLTETGDILLYGCNVAQGEEGIQFIQSLAQATGADVAGSTDLTGPTSLGGDWVLESSTGMIEAVARVDLPLETALATGQKTGSNSADAVFYDNYYVSTSIAISGAPTNAVITSVSVSWDVDAN